MKTVTDRLYYQDCYLASFTAQLIDQSDEGCRVYLDRTAFYPTSGGQPNDVGLLGGARVIDVVDQGERIAHVTEAPVDPGSVDCEIDWRHRYDHMQQHTGQHVLSAAFVELFGFATLSFHMGAEGSTIELGTQTLSDGQMDEAEERANAIAREARPVLIRFETSESVQDLRKASERTGTLRIIEIEGIDRSACGGTHVRSTAEIAPIQIRKAERIRGNTRIEFVCGTRAVRRTKQDLRIAQELARLGAVGIGDLPEYVASIQRRLVMAEKEKQKREIEIAQFEANSLYESTAVSSDGLRRILLQVPAINDATRAKVQAFTGRGKALALVIGTDPRAVIVAASSDSGVNAGAVLKKELSRVGARGGGSSTFAQGSLPDQAVADSLRAALKISD